jgi:hypothetical protein
MDAMEEIREQLSAADLRARAVLADAIAQIESRLTSDLEQRECVQASTELAIETLQRSVVGSATDVARALGQVSEMCAIVSEKIEADRVERRALTEAIAALARSQTAALDAPARTIGGTVYAAPSAPEDAALSLESTLSIDSGPDEPEIVLTEDDEDDRAHYEPRPDVTSAVGSEASEVRTVRERLTDAVYRYTARSSE